MNPLDEKYGAKTTQIVDAENNIMQYDVLDESIKNGESLESTLEKVRYNDKFAINDVNYYKEKYGNKSNPSNPDALDDAQIESMYKRAKVLEQVNNKVRKQGFSFSDVTLQQKVEQARTKTKGYIWNPFTTEAKTVESYEGFVDYGTGKTAKLGTMQQLAENNDRMLVKGVDASGKPTYNYVQKPRSQEEMHRLYGKGYVVRATQDETDNNKPILVAEQANEFVKNDEIYSTKFGAQELYGNQFNDFFKGVYNGIFPGTVNSYNQVKALLNDTFRYDDNYLFTQGRQTIYNYGNELLGELKTSGDAKSATILKQAMDSGDYVAMKDAYKMALSRIDPMKANKLRAVAQPLNWQRVNNEIQELNNKMGAASMAISEGTKYGTNAGAFVANLGETIGMMIPQVALGFVTGGTSTLVSSMAGGARAIQMANAISTVGRGLGTILGTSQAVSDVYRTGVEMGVDRELLGNVMIASLPVVALTERITNGWMFKAMDDVTRKTFVKDIYQKGLSEVAELAGKGGTQVEIEAASRGIWAKLFKHPKFQQWIDKDSFAASTVKAYASELPQENMEDTIYVALEKLIDSKAPINTEEGAGQYGAEYSWEQVGQTSAGTILATTLLNTFLTGIPRMVRHNKGLPDTKSDVDGTKWLQYKVLNNETQSVFNEMHDEYLKGNWDPNGMTVADITGDKDNPMYVIPKSEFLQSVGLEEGKQIETVNEMRFVEAATSLEALDSLAKDMKMSETDKSVLLQLGFSGQILLNESFEAMKSMVEANKAIQAIAKPEPTGNAEEDAAAQAKYESDIRPLKAKYDKAKAIYDTHTTKEDTQGYYDKMKSLELQLQTVDPSSKNYGTIQNDYEVAKQEYNDFISGKTGTGYSSAINRLMKDSVTMLNQVNDKMKSINNLTDSELNNKKLKNDKKFQEQYFNAWKEIVSNKFGYDNYYDFFKEVERVKEANRLRRVNQRNRIENREDFNVLLESATRITEGFENLKAEFNKNSFKQTMGEFNSFAKNLAFGLSSKNSYLNNQELEQLSSKYSELHSKAQESLSQLLDIEVESAKKDDPDFDKEDIDELNEELQKEYLDSITDTVYDDKGNEEEISIKLNEDAPQYFKDVDGKLVFSPYRNETDEAIALRQQQELDDVNKEYAGYLDEDIEQREDLLKEISVWVDSIINKNNEYKTQYPNGRFKDSNAGVQARNALQQLDNIKDYVLNSFEIAKHIADDKRYNEHATKGERAFTANLAEVDENGINPLKARYNELFKKVSSLKEQVGQAEYLERAKRDHMATVMHENVLGSLRHIIDLGITNPDGSLLTHELFDKLRNLGPVPTEILQANGNYTPQQIEYLAQRESLMNNILSFLQNNKEIVFNDTNKPRVFAVFEKFQTNYITQSQNYDFQKGSMFYLDDSEATSGSVDQVKTSREKFMVTPMKKGDYYFYEAKYGSGNHSQHEAKMRLKEHLNVLMWIDSGVSINDIVEARKEIIKENKDQETAEQEYVSNSIIAFTTNKGVPTYEKLFNYLNRDNVYTQYVGVDKNGKPKKNKVKNPDGTLTDIVYSVDNYFNSITVTGDYGVGKTQFVFKRAIELLGKIRGNDVPFKNVSIVNITKNLEAVHKDTFSPLLPENTQYINLKRDFIDNLDNIDLSEDKLYIIDEASIITQKEYEKIVAKFKGSSAKIIFLGDMFQMRDAKGKSNLPFVLTRTMSTHLLTEQFSSNSQLLRELSDQPRAKAVGTLNKEEEVPVVWNTKVFSKVVNGKLMGAKYFISEQEMVSEFASNITSESKRAIIFSNQAHLDSFISKHAELGKTLKEHSDKVYFAFREGGENTDRLIQGLREEEVYVVVNPLTTRDEFKIADHAIVASALYTSIGRASNFVGLIGTDMSLNVTNENEALSIGQPNTKDNPLVEDMKRRFREKNMIRFNAIDSKDFRTKVTTTTQPAANKASTTTSTTGTTQQNIKKDQHDFIVNGEKVTVYVTVDMDNEKVVYKYDYKGKKHCYDLTGNSHNLPYSEILDLIGSAILDRHKTNSGTTKTSSQPVAFIAFNNGNTVTIGDVIIVNGVEGTVESINEINNNGGITYEIELSDSSILQTVNINSDVKFKDIVDESVSVSSAAIETTESFKIFSQHINNNELAIFGSSASLINMSATTSLEDRNKRRNLNDLIISNINAFLQYGKVIISYENASYLDDKGYEVKGNYMVIRFKITDGVGFNTKARELSKSYKGISDLTGIDLAIGTLSEPAIPELEFDGKEYHVVYKSMKASSYDATERARLEKAWNDIKVPGKNIDEMRDMQLAIFDLYAGKLQEYEVKGFDDGRRVIEYSKTPQTLFEFEDKAQHVITYGTPKIGNNKAGSPRIIVPIRIGNEKHDLILAMPQYKDNPVALERLKDVLKLEKNFFKNTIDNFDSSAQEDEKLNILKQELSRTSLFKLLINNYSLLKTNTGLVTSVLKDLVTIKDNKHIDIHGKTTIEFINNYLAIINNIEKLNSTSDMGMLYDFARKIKDQNSRVTYVNSNERPLLEDKTAIMTHAVRLNNRSIYPRIDKPAAPAQNVVQQTPPPAPAPNKPGTRARNIKFQHVEKVNQNNDLSNWVSDLDNFLGSDFLASEYLTVTDRVLRDDNGKLVAGYVENNTNMVLSTATGKRNTARHESFHFIFKNYIKPEQVARLKAAARVIAKFETKEDITGNEEEWMAYDFGNGRTPKYQSIPLNNAIGIWEKFKAFMKNLLRFVNPLYYAEKTLINEYNNIESGLYRNRLNEIVVSTESNISYSNDVDDNLNDYFSGEYERSMQSEDMVGTRNAIIIANDVKTRLKTEALTNEALVQTELLLGYELNEMSLLSSNPDFNGLVSLPNVIDTLVSKYNNQYKESKAYTAEVYGRGEMTFEEIELQDLSKSIISFDDKLEYDYHIFSKGENIKELIQLKVPTFNMANNEWGTTAGPDARFDWSNYRPEDYLSDDKKIFLSSIPRVNYDGNIDHEKGTFIPFHQVTEIMKEIGASIDGALVQYQEQKLDEAGAEFWGTENFNDRFGLLKKRMETIIKKAKIKDNKFVDEKTQIIYSIYSRIFGTIPGMLKINYSDINGLDKSISLMDKFDSLQQNINKLSKTLYDENNQLAPNDEIRGMKQAATSILDFVNGMTTVYVSMYMKDTLKSTYYNNTVKTQRMFKQTYITDSHRITNSQKNQVIQGKLDSQAVRTFDENIAIHESNVKDKKSVSIRFKAAKQDVLTYNNGKWTFVTDKGVAMNVNYTEDYKNLLLFFDRMKNFFGLTIMKPNTFKRIIEAKTWDEVTDAMYEINDIGFTSNYMHEIKNSYSERYGLGPKDFMADYLGNIAYMMYLYKKEHKTKFIDDSGDVIDKPETLGVYMKNGPTGESLEKRIQSVDGSEVIESFLNKTQPKTFERLEDNEDVEVGAEIRHENDERTNNDYFFYNPNDFSVANQLLASIIQKIEGKVNDGARLTAEGTRMYPYISKSAFNEQIMEMVEPVYGIKIESIVESTGISRNIGFTTYGTNNVETADYIEQSLNLFAQNIYQNKFYVPVKPASDTGNIRYMDLSVSFLSTDGGFHIDYKNFAHSLLGLIDNHNEKVAKSQNRIFNFVNELKKVEGFTSMVLDTNNMSIEDVINELNNYALKNDLMPQLIKAVEQSELTKDSKVYDKADMSNFDIGFKGVADEKGVFVANGIIPGRLPLDQVKGLSWMKTRVKGVSVIEKIRGALEKKNEKDIERFAIQLFGKDYKQFSKFVVSNGFKAFGSVNKISNKVNAGILNDKSNFFEKNKRRETKVNQLYFGYYITTLMANYATEVHGMDSESFNGFMDLVKRFGSDNTPAQQSLVSQKVNGRHTGVLLNTSKIMVIRDPQDVFEETFKTVDNKEELSKDKPVEVTNGQTWVSPFWYTFFKRSFGGESSVLGNSKALKPLGNMKRSDGSYMLLKSAFHVLSSSDLKHQGLMNVFVRMIKESDKIFVGKLMELDGSDQRFISFYEMFNRYYDASTDKDIDKIMDDMHTEVLLWQDMYGEQFYKAAVESIVSMMAPISTIKSPVRQMNSYDPLMDGADLEDSFSFDELDNSKLRAVMNPSQPTNTSKSQAQPSQFDAQMGVGDETVRLAAEQYRANRSLLQDKVEKELKIKISEYKPKDGIIPANGKQFKDIDFNSIDPFDTNNIPVWIDKALEQLESYLRETVAADISLNNEDLAYIQLLRDEDVSKHLPIIRSRLIASYRNIVNRAVQGRTSGARLTQMSGYYHRFFTDENGNKMNKLDVLDQLNINNGGWKGLSFEEFNSYTDEVLATHGFTAVPLYDMSVGDTKTNTGTISMPNLFADKYGHRKDETLFQINTVNMNGSRLVLLKNGESNAEEIFNTLISTLEQLKANNDGPGMKQIMTNFLNSPMIRKAVSNLGILEDIEMIKQAVDTGNPLSENAATELKNKYSRLLRNDASTEEEIENAELLAKKKLLEKRFDKSFDELTTTEKIIGELVKDIDSLTGSFDTLYSIIEEATELSKHFNESLQMMLSRVPLTFIGSGGVYDVVDFNNDNGNIVYIPIGMTNRNDADFDIDALTAYVNSIDNNGKIIRKGSLGIINKMNEQRIAVYTDKANEKQLLIKSKTGNIKSVPEQHKRKSLSSKEDDTINNSPMAIFSAYDRNKAGADAIGILANALNSISMIMTMKLQGKESYSKGSMMESIMNANIQLNKLLKGSDQSIIYRLGSWEQIALDNNKSNTMGAYNIRSYVVNILASLVIDGKTPEQIYEFFNNDTINEIFDEYAKGQRLNESSKNYDLFVITNEKIKTIDNKLNNSSLANFKQLTTIDGVERMPINLKLGNQAVSKQLDDAIDYIDSEINKLMYDPTTDSGLIIDFEGKKLDSKYINDKIDINKGIEKFRKDNNLTVNDILNGDIIDKLSDEIDNFEQTALYKHIKAIQELYTKQTLNTAASVVNRLPNYIVVAESLFRLSQVMKLRNGLRVLDGDFNSSKIYVENALGMSLKEYSTTIKINTIEDHMKYFMLNNDAYLALEQEAKKDGSSDAVMRMSYMLQKERMVFNELNISDFVRSVPQLDNIVRMFDQQDTLTQLMFLADNPVFKQLSLEFMSLQNKAHMTYANQLSKFNDAVYELVFDKYFSGTNHEVTVKNIDYDFTNVFDRQEFALAFPNYAINIQNNMYNAKFWEQMLPFDEFNKISSDQLKSLQNNLFLNSLMVSGQSRFKLMTSVNTKNMTGVELSKYQDSFNQLPESLKRMFLFYELIENKMNFKKGSIMHIIGVDFYSGNLSKTFNDIANSLFQNNLAAFTDPDNIDNLKDRFFDYLGMNEEFAVSVPFNSYDKVNGPKYIYNKGEKKQTQDGETYYGKRTLFFKKDSDGNYIPLNRNTWKSSISVDQDTFSPYVSFVRNSDEIAAFKENERNGHSTYHYSRMSNVEKGDILITGKEVVVVTSIKNGKMGYRSATDYDKNLFAKKLDNKIRHMNNAVVLTPGTNEYNLLHIDASSPITITKDINIMVNNKYVFEDNQVFNSIHEAIRYFHNKTMEMMVPKWGVLGDDKHISSSYKNLLYQASNINDPLVAEKQVAVMAHMYGTTVLLKEIMKQKFAAAEANGIKLKNIFLNSENEFMKLGNYHDSFRIGKSTYSEVVKEAFKEYSGVPTKGIMDKETEVLSYLDVENISNLFQGDKDTLHKLYNTKNKKVAQQIVETESLREDIADLSAQMELIDGERAYDINGRTFIRFGNAIQWLKNKALAHESKKKLSIQKFIYGYDNLSGTEKVFADRQYEAYLQGTYLVNRAKKESLPLSIGSSVDSSFRDFMNRINTIIQSNKLDPENSIDPLLLLKEQLFLSKNNNNHIITIDGWDITHPKDMKYAVEHQEQLKTIFIYYAIAWINWAKTNGFEIEFIADEIPVYSDAAPTMVNQMIKYEDENGNLVNASGVASKLDLVVRLTKTRGGMKTVSDIVLDFKTINLGQEEEKIKSQVLGWNIQTHATALMYRENYGVSLHNQNGSTMYGILPIETKYDNKKFIGFDIPKDIDVTTKTPIKSNIERWNNSTEYDKKNNYMPMYRSSLSANPQFLIESLIGLRDEEQGITLANNYNNESEDNDKINNCSIK